MSGTLAHFKIFDPEARCCAADAWSIRRDVSALRKEILDVRDCADRVAGDDCSLLSGDFDMAGFSGG
jgi:hypothetical protein